MHPKNTFYGVAWEIVLLPPRDGDFGYGPNYWRRREIKKACRAYAKGRGYDMWSVSIYGNEETWQFLHEGRLLKEGTLQECCLHLVAHEVEQGMYSQDLTAPNTHAIGDA